MRLLLIEDDIDLAQVLSMLLNQQGYVVDVAETLAIAKHSVQDSQYDIVVLDRMLPDGDGLELIKFCKDRGFYNRYLVLSALNELGQKVEGLDLGADDYLAKPFEPEELLARLRVALRRNIAIPKKVISLGKVTLDLDTRDLLVRGAPLILPRREKLVIELLLKRNNRVVSREALEQCMYSFDDEVNSNTLESHISRLRKNLTKHDTKLAIQTVRGSGYLLKEEV